MAAGDRFPLQPVARTPLSDQHLYHVPPHDRDLDVPSQIRPKPPPGHSSWSAAGLGYLTWALLTLLQPFDGAGHVWRLLTGSLPALAAVAVGVSRYVDSWHHPTDIVAGLALGFVVSWLAFACVRARGSGSGGVFGSGAFGGGLLGSAGAGALGGGFGGAQALSEDDIMAQPLLVRGGGGAGGGAGSAAQLPQTNSFGSLPV